MPESMSWVSPDGTTIQLDGSTGYKVLVGPQGRFAPPLVLRGRAVPQQPGERFDSIQVLPREVDLPIIVRDATALEVRAKIEALVSALDPARGEGELRVIRPDASVRILRCRYSAGLEGDEGQGMASHWQKFIAVLRASDPYWYASARTALTMTVNPSSSFFPILPLVLASSEVFTEETVTNGGDVEAWPVWTITGPGIGLSLRNLTTGEETTLGASIGTGETITIDTRPGAKSVVRGASENIFGSISDDSVLWPLASGDNDLLVQMGAATTESRVQLFYTERFRTA